MHPLHHAQSSVRKFGGRVEDFLPLHGWLDQSKEHLCDWRHRLLRHHSEGIFEAERVFGPTLITSDGKAVPTRYVAEQHIREDLGVIPTLADWLRNLRRAPWMSRGYQIDDDEYQKRAGAEGSDS
jgi:hypothetical protein